MTEEMILIYVGSFSVLALMIVIDFTIQHFQRKEK